MPGKIGWIDLTVADAAAIRDFYQSVTGWIPAPVEMGEYQDFCMHPPGEPEPAAGICHARGHNAQWPAVWMLYIKVDDLDESLRRCEARGGKRRSEIRTSPMGRYCAIEDPAGAVSALFESPK